jgi:N-acyl homoserine lactone hydrolase
MIHPKPSRRTALALLFPLAIFAAPASAQKPSQSGTSPRLYVFDCGVLDIPDTDRYNLKRDELTTNLMSCSAFLIAHPKGTLMWDAGVVADSEFPADGGPGKLQYATATKKLLPQLAAAGYSPKDITYLAFSHFHWDHVGNGNAFASSTWLVRQKERDIMFAEPPSDRTIPAHFSALKNSKTVIIKDDEYDVFGDGSVIMKSAPGHSPDHQVLLVRLKKTGPVLLSGDLWHYPEERKLNRFPKTDFDVEQTKASRKAIEAYIQKTGAQLWIQHDYTGNQKLKKAPAFYE